MTRRNVFDGFEDDPRFEDRESRWGCAIFPIAAGLLALLAWAVWR